jgi:hypothetical protein
MGGDRYIFPFQQFEEYNQRRLLWHMDKNMPWQVSYHMQCRALQ